MGVEPSVPKAQSTRHTATSPARTSCPDLAERIFSLMVLADTEPQNIRRRRAAVVPSGARRFCQEQADCVRSSALEEKWINVFAKPDLLI